MERFGTLEGESADQKILQLSEIIIELKYQGFDAGWWIHTPPQSIFMVSKSSLTRPSPVRKCAL